MQLPTKNIETLIPQRHPIVMVDALLTFSEGRLSAGFTVAEDNIFVENGNLQASGLLEHQAQSVAMYTGYKYFLEGNTPPVGYIGAVKFFEVKQLPKVGETLTTTIEIVAEMNGVTLVKTETKIGEEVIATSEMKTVIA